MSVLTYLRKPGSRRRTRRMEGFKKQHRAEAKRRKLLALEHERRERNGESSWKTEDHLKEDDHV